MFVVAVRRRRRRRKGSHTHTHTHTHEHTTQKIVDTHVCCCRVGKGLVFISLFSLFSLFLYFLYFFISLFFGLNVLGGGATVKPNPFPARHYYYPFVVEKKSKTTHTHTMLCAHMTTDEKEVEGAGGTMQCMFCFTTGTLGTTMRRIKGKVKKTANKSSEMWAHNSCLEHASRKLNETDSELALRTIYSGLVRPSLLPPPSLRGSV